MCFFEGVRVNEGRGTNRPFLKVGAPWSPEAAQQVVDTLRAYDLSGVAVDTIAYTPRSLRGAPSPRFQGERVYGFELDVTSRTEVDPLAVGMHALHAMYQQSQAQGDTNFVSRAEHLTRLAGTDRLLGLLRAGASPDSIVAAWEKEVAAFRSRRSSALLY
jgi:uncharacterized protein YbbC (DUF1343 family)